jgi:hypothetical protein
VCVSEKRSSRNKTAEVTAVLISSSVSAATTGYGCKNLILPLICLSVHEMVCVYGS